MQDNSPRRNHRGLCTYEGNKMWNYEILGTDIYHLLAAFVLYSILGWALESTYMSFCNHKLTNRGFGKGPFCPIYGSGGIIITSLSMTVVSSAWKVLLPGAFMQ